MKIIEVINAYVVLRELNLADMSEEVMNAIWNNLKLMRPVAEEYDADVETRRKTLYDEKMAQPVRDLTALQEQMKNGYVPSQKEQEDMAPIVRFLKKFNEQFNSAIAELNVKEVKIKLVKIASSDLLHLLKVNKKSFREMEQIACVAK